MGRMEKSYKIGAIALAFLVIGYQSALFIHRAAVLRIVSNRDRPDTVYIVVDSVSRQIVTEEIPVSHPSEHSAVAEAVYTAKAGRRVECFLFNPNTVSLTELQRLGFSPKQAAAIDNYRKKGGVFRRKSDFAKSFVVADSVYKRLEPFIDIPLVDLNKADSAAFDALPGIGGYFAAKMVEYREELQGYSYPEQLMDIYRFDRERFDGLKDLITVGTDSYPPYPLWTLDEEELARHPYIGEWEAHGIVLFRDHNPPSKLSVEALVEAGVIKKTAGDKLSRCRINPIE